MSHFNYTRFEIGGRLLNDPVRGVLPSGMTLCDMVVAVNEMPDAPAAFVPVSCYGDMAEFALASCRKRTAVFITGRIDVKKVEREGDTFRRVRLLASAIRFVDSRAESEAELPFVFDGEEPFAEDVTSNTSL